MKPTIVVQVLTVLLNAVLSPIMIAGWFTGRPLGVAGAGLSTSISLAVGVLLMAIYFARLERYVYSIRRCCAPRWRRGSAS